jgi:hypothetical protein
VGFTLVSTLRIYKGMALRLKLLSKFTL